MVLESGRGGVVPGSIPGRGPPKLNKLRKRLPSCRVGHGWSSLSVHRPRIIDKKPDRVFGQTVIEHCSNSSTLRCSCAVAVIAARREVRPSPLSHGRHACQHLQFEYTSRTRSILGRMTRCQVRNRRVVSRDATISGKEKDAAVRYYMQCDARERRKETLRGGIKAFCGSDSGGRAVEVMSSCVAAFLHDQ